MHVSCNRPDVTYDTPHNLLHNTKRIRSTHMRHICYVDMLLIWLIQAQSINESYVDHYGAKNQSDAWAMIHEFVVGAPLWLPPQPRWFSLLLVTEHIKGYTQRANNKNIKICSRLEQEKSDGMGKSCQQPLPPCPCWKLRYILAPNTGAIFT